MSNLLNMLEYSVSPQKVIKVYTNYNRPFNIIFLICSIVFAISAISMLCFFETDIFKDFVKKIGFPDIAVRLILGLAGTAFLILAIFLFQIITSVMLLIITKIFKNLFKNSLNFTQSLTIVSLSATPLIMAIICNGLFLIIAREMFFYLPTSISYYLQDAIPTQLLNSLQIIDVFLIWHISLIAIGSAELLEIRGNKTRYHLIVSFCFIVTFGLLNVLI